MEISKHCKSVVVNTLWIPAVAVSVWIRSPVPRRSSWDLSFPCPRHRHRPSLRRLSQSWKYYSRSLAKVSPHWWDFLFYLPGLLLFKPFSFHRLVLPLTCSYMSLVAVQILGTESVPIRRQMGHRDWFRPTDLAQGRRMLSTVAKTDIKYLYYYTCHYNHLMERIGLLCPLFLIHIKIYEVSNITFTLQMRKSLAHLRQLVGRAGT